MKSTKLTILLVFIIVAINLMTSNIFAKDVEPEGSIEITPYYTTIVLVHNGLTHNSGGKLSCVGETSVQRGYRAGVKMELQELSNSWTTIKTWDYFHYKEQLSHLL